MQQQELSYISTSNNSWGLDWVWQRCCVYAIVNTRNGKMYVGSTVNLAKRWSEHRNALRAGTHISTHLRRAWEQDGESAFEWRVLEDCAPETVIEREQYWCDFYRSWDMKSGYNLRREAASNRGNTLSAETRAKMSAAHKGRKQTPEHAAKQCAARRGRKHSLEQRLKMGTARRSLSVETARELKRLLSEGELSQSQIASQLGLGYGFVSKVNLGKILWIEHLET